MTTVLIVDDYDSIRELYAHILREAGYAVCEARHGVEALAILRSVRELPELIILDIHMPQMNGFRFCAEVRADARLAKIPILLSSSDPYLDDIAAALGLCGGFEKCPSPQVMLSAVAQALPPSAATNHMPF